jgi:hypothetical protein
MLTNCRAEQYNPHVEVVRADLIDIDGLSFEAALTPLGSHRRTLQILIYTL